MDPLNFGQRPLAMLSAIVSVVLVQGCGKGGAQAPAPVDVNVAVVASKDVPVVRDWIGSLDGFVDAQIHAQVPGYLIKQDYKEGASVKTGDLLFEIDPRPFEALVAQAQGQVGQAEAQVSKTSADVDRFTPLARDKAISQEELDDAVQAHAAAEALLTSAKAALDQARLNLSFTRICSPVDGVAGLETAQIGDLVGPTTGAITHVSQVDPIKAIFPISEQAYLEFRAREPRGPSIPAGIEFTLILADGSTYPTKGTFYAIDDQVDANTGTLKVVATFPNPSGLLRPGQYAHIRAVVDTQKGALIVPQRALSELQGGYQAAVIDPENHIHIVSVVPGSQVGGMVVALSGLHAGDRLVADGIQKVRDGATVNPLPETEPVK